VGHSRKILAQTGTSLADVYRIEGSIAGLEALDVTDIKGVHDLGPQIHSERLRSFIVGFGPGASLQTVTWSATAGGIPDSVNRFLGLAVIADVAARITNAQVSIRDPNGSEIPIWNWDITNDVANTIVVARPAAGAGAEILLVGKFDHSIELLTRIGPTNVMPDMVFRGLTETFGAGTVNPLCLFHVARPNSGAPPAGEPSSHGLPIPGW